jgi:DNA-binding Xre family transcriptional regulator
MNQDLIFSNIEKLLEERQMPKMTFYSKIGMSDVGYNKMRKGGSLKMITLAKIAEVLQVSIISLMQMPSHNSQLNDPDAGYITAIDVLYKLQRSLKENIASQQKQIEEIEKFLNHKPIIK